MGQPTPRIDCILICKNTQTVDRAANVHNLIGIHSAMTVLHEFPVHTGRLFLYFRYTNIKGEVTFQINFVDLRNDVVTFTRSFTVASTDETNVNACEVQIDDITLHHAGVYEFRILYQSEILGRTHFKVIQR